MPRTLSSRAISITLFLIVLAAIAIGSNWGQVFGISVFTATDSARAQKASTLGPPALIINEILADPGTFNGDANGDGSVGANNDEFIELINDNAVDVDISGFTLSDAVSVRHIFPANTIVSAGCGIVIFGGGTPSGSFGYVVVQTASSGSLSLDNSGDTVTLADTSSTVVASYTYGAEGNFDQSLTRDPDITGPVLIKHTLATGALGNFSPGRKVNGTNFAGCAPPSPTATNTPTNTGAWVINEINADPSGDANGDGSVNADDDEFLELVNDTGASSDISGFTVSDSTSVRHTFPENTVVPAGCGIVIFGGGAPAGTFGYVVVQTVSSGTLSLDNTGDTVTLADTASQVVATYTYGAEGNQDQSLTREPDITGPDPLVKHTVATGAIGNFSPGHKVNGTNFIGCSALSPTPSNTSTDTPTDTPTGKPTPTLGNYPNTSVVLSDNTTITPDAAPTDTTSISVATATGFVGELTADPVTGVVRVTNAHHANITPGTYTVTVKAFGPGGIDTKTFDLTVTTVPACEPVAFGTAFDLTAGTSTVAIAVGDFNGDENQDIAAPNYGSANVSVFLGNGSGGFSSATNFVAGNTARSAAVGDFNGDGKQDIVVANFGDDNVSILLGDGAGVFAAAVNFAAGDGPQSVAIGDFNGDGQQDLAVGGYNSADVSVLMGNGSGAFAAAVPFAVGVGPIPVVVGDFNGDGNQDIATGNYFADNVSVLIGDGTGGFSSAVNFGVGSAPHFLAVGDFNADGNQDLVTANRFSNNVSVLIGNGTGGFAAAVNTTVGNEPMGVAVGDFNGDGNQDLAVANHASNTLSILVGNGLGGFFAPVDFGIGASIYADVVGDFNGDGKQDIATANFSGTVSVLPRSCAVTASPTATPTDTPTPAETPSIGGTVTYGNSNAGTKFISNATVASTVGSPGVSTTTAAPGGTAGQYTLTGFGSGSYTIGVTKTTGQNSVTSNDAAQIAQHVAGTLLITANNKKIAADTSGNGSISSNDAALIARFVAGLGPPIGNTNQWRFFVPNPTFPIGASPTTRSYTDPIGNPTGEDFIGILIGEVSGNWNPTAARPAGDGDEPPRQPKRLPPLLNQGGELLGPERNMAVELPTMAASSDKVIVVPVNVQGIANKGVISYEFDLRYDASVMQPLVDPVNVKDTASRGLSVVTNATEPGLLRVVVYGAFPIDENGVLLNLRFTAVGSAGSVSPLLFEQMMFNEGEPRVSIANGQVELF